MVSVVAMIVVTIATTWAPAVMAHVTAVVMALRATMTPRVITTNVRCLPSVSSLWI
jgi:hypothetical protein